ncbi:hypothetical protein ACOMHN_062705 [Nucella lapillus]
MADETNPGEEASPTGGGRVGNLLLPHCLKHVEHGKGFSVTSKQEDHPPLASRGNLVPPQGLTGMQHGNGFSETTTRSALLQLTNATVRERRESTSHGGDSLCRHSDSNPRAARGGQAGIRASHGNPRRKSPQVQSATERVGVTVCVQGCHRTGQTI